MEYIDDNVINHNFNFGFKLKAYNCIRLGNKAALQFMSENKHFFNYPKGSSLIGRLRTYAIERQFYLSSISEDSKFLTYVSPLNHYGYKGLFLKTDDFNVNIARTNGCYKLPPETKYRLALAKTNAGANIQLSFDSTSFGILCNDSKYAILAYGIYMDEITYTSLLVPTSDYKGVIYSHNFLDEVKVQNNYISEPVQEKQISKLKEELKNFVDLGEINEAQ